MYSKGEGKGAKHEWIPSTDNIGVLSYLYIRVFAHFAGDMFTSMTCQSLSSSSLIQIPRSHILLSLTSAMRAITFQQLNSSNGHPMTLVTLCSYSSAILLQFRQCQDALYTGVEALRRNMRAKDAGAPSSTPGPQLASEEHAEESDGESDVDSVVQRLYFILIRNFLLLCVYFSINFMSNPPCG